MKFKSILSFVVTAVLAVSFTSNTYAQRCDKKDFCDENVDYENYDYRTQSYFATVYPGDTIKVTAVMYTKKQYKAFVCADPELGGVKYRVVRPVRKSKKVLLRTEVDTIIDYKLDDYGEIAYPEENNYEPVEIGRKIEKKPIYEVQRYVDEEVVFDSEKGKGYAFTKDMKRTTRYFIYVYLPEDGRPAGGCLNVYIGRRDTGKRNMQREGRVSYVR